MKRRIIVWVLCMSLFFASLMLSSCKKEPEISPGLSPKSTPPMTTVVPPTSASVAPPTSIPPTGAQGTGEKPQLSDKIKLGENGIPVLRVYIIEEKTVKEMDIETYLEGVLAGEMKNDWPDEALRAQAILARTFVLQFVSEKESKYKDADISTDIEEAQAYNAKEINDKVKNAVRETKGQVLSFDGKLIYAWFYAHAGGVTALAKEGLDWQEEEPGYTQSVESPDSDKAPDDVKSWKASFTKKEVIGALNKAGLSVEDIKSVKIGEKGESGRAVTLDVDGKTISAAAFRIAIGSTDMKSTLLTDMTFSGNKLTMQGKGFGHGVGMSQWGAYGMAEDGKNHEEIIMHYFKEVSVVSLW